jgi:hypothetical protein
VTLYADMLLECHENDLVVPSLESLLAGPTYPKCHMIFYNICIKPMAGGVAWRTALKSGFEHVGCFGTPTDFAFAYLILENNYQSWMKKGRDYKYKLVTEYDDRNVWKDRQFYAGWKIQYEYNTNASRYADYCVFSAEKARFESAKKERERTFKELHKTIKGTFVLESPDGGSEEDTPPKGKRKHNDTKRYTKGGSGRRRYGGWTDNAHIKLEEVGEMIRDDRGKGNYLLLEQAVHQWQREELAMNEGSDEEADDEERHTVDRTKAWDL